MSYINTHKTNENVVRIVVVIVSFFCICVFCFCYFRAQSKITKTTNNTRSTVAHSWVFIYSCLLFAAVLLYSLYKATTTKADCLWVWALFVASPYRTFRVSPESEGACGRAAHTPARQCELEQRRSVSWLSNVETQRNVYATCSTRNVLINS